MWHRPGSGAPRLMRYPLGGLAAIRRVKAMTNESSRRNLFLALGVVALLHTGASISQSYVNYPGWYVLEAESFKAYHWPMSLRAAVFLMAPRLIELILALVVLKFRPEAVERWILIVGVTLTAGGILATALVSRPIHAQLDIQGNTPELVSRLMATDWIRNPLEGCAPHSMSGHCRV
jgi:hypothetical protein